MDWERMPRQALRNALRVCKLGPAGVMNLNKIDLIQFAEEAIRSEKREHFLNVLEKARVEEMIRLDEVAKKARIKKRHPR